MSAGLSSSRSHGRRFDGLVLALALALFVLLTDLFQCPVAAIWSLPCPGCGLTRAARCLLHGDLAGALRWHPLSPLLVPALPLWIGLEIANRSGSRAPPAVASLRRMTDRLAPWLLGLVLGVWLLRFFGAFGGPVPVS